MNIKHAKNIGSSNENPQSAKADSVDIYQPEIIPDNTDKLFQQMNDRSERHEELIQQKILTSKLSEVLDRLEDSQSANYINDSGILTISNSETEVTYLDKDNNSLYKAIFKTNSNAYKLLMCLARMPGKQFSVDELRVYLNKPREGASEALPARRVSDTITSIKKAFEPLLTFDFIVRNNNSYSITCNVLLIP